MPTVIDIPNNWKPRSYQAPAWRYLQNGGKRAVIVAHRRWGKDDLALHRTCCAAFERPANYWHMLPEYGQARKAVWSAVNPHSGKRRIDEAFPHALRSGVREDTMSISFKNGSTWQVVGSDSFNSLVGAAPAGLIFSEYSIADPAAWAYLRPILLENGGWAAFIYTARGRNHGYALLESAKREPDWYAEVSTAHKTGVFTSEQLASERRQYEAEHGEAIGGALFEQEYLCSFDAAIVGSYFTRELRDAEEEGRICDLTIDETLPIYSAWDLGIRDSTAIWFFQVRYGGVEFVDFYRSSGVGLEHYRDVIRDRGYKPFHDFVPHDAAAREWGTGRTRVETMASMGLKPRKVADHRIMDRINAARQTIKRSRFDRTHCAEGLDGLREYRSEYDREARVLKAVPLHNWASDPADAFGYASLAWRELVIETPKPDPVYPYMAGELPGTMRSGLTFREIVDRQARLRRGED